MMNMSDMFVKYGWIIILGLIGMVVGIVQFHKQSPAFQKRTDAMLLKLPIFGDIIQKATIARWARTQQHCLRLVCHWLKYWTQCWCER